MNQAKHQGDALTHVLTQKGVFLLYAEQPRERGYARKSLALLAYYHCDMSVVCAYTGEEAMLEECNALYEMDIARRHLLRVGKDKLNPRYAAMSVCGCDVGEVFNTPDILSRLQGRKVGLMIVNNVSAMKRHNNRRDLKRILANAAKFAADNDCLVLLVSDRLKDVTEMEGETIPYVKGSVLKRLAAVPAAVGTKFDADMYQRSADGLRYEMRPEFRTAYRLSVNKQLTNWAAGKPEHNAEFNECCPDFSCCVPSMEWTQLQKDQFISAAPEHRISFLAAGLVNLVTQT